MKNFLFLGLLGLGFLTFGFVYGTSVNSNKCDEDFTSLDKVEIPFNYQFEEFSYVDYSVANPIFEKNYVPSTIGKPSKLKINKDSSNVYRRNSYRGITK